MRAEGLMVNPSSAPEDTKSVSPRHMHPQSSCAVDHWETGSLGASASVTLSPCLKTSTAQPRATSTWTYRYKHAECLKKRINNRLEYSSGIFLFYVILKVRIQIHTDIYIHIYIYLCVCLYSDLVLYCAMCIARMLHRRPRVAK